MQAIHTITAMLLSLLAPARTEAESPVVVSICPTGLITSTVGGQQVTGSSGNATQDSLQVSQQLMSPHRYGAAFTAVVQNEMLWIEFAGRGPFGGGGAYSRVVIRYSANHFCEDRIALADSGLANQPMAKGTGLSISIFPKWANFFSLDHENEEVSEDKKRGTVLSAHLLPIDSDSCYRFELIQPTKKENQLARILYTDKLVSVVTEKSYSTKCVSVESIPCPFEKKFQAIFVGPHYYFITASGAMYTAEKAKNGAPQAIKPVTLDPKGRIIGMVTDTRTKQVFVFTQLADQSLRYHEIGDDPKWATDAKWVTVKEKVHPDQLASPMQATRLMTGILRKDEKVKAWAMKP